MAGRKRRRIATGKTLWKWWWWWWRWQGWQYNDSGTLLQATATPAATPRSDYLGEAAAAAAIGPLQVRRRRQHILVFLGIVLPVLQFSLKLHTQRCNQKTQRGCLRTAFKRASDILVSSLFPPWRCSWSRGGCRIPKLFHHLLARQCRHSTIPLLHSACLRLPVYRDPFMGGISQERGDTARS